MVQSRAATVDAWMQEAEPERRPFFEQVRALALKRLGVGAEAMEYGMPCYRRPGDQTNCFAFNSQKQYLALYIQPELQAKYAGRLGTRDTGKSCVRYRRGDQIPMDVIDQILVDTAASGPVLYERGRKG
jgi:uncharacterized protein YdhG (YjbR/CyaY superfamily)